MLKKLEFIANRLPLGRTDVWEAEMLYKLLSRDLADPTTIESLQSKFSNPGKSFNILIQKLYREAHSTSVVN